MNTGFGRHRKGMTLIELVISLMVISIAAVGTGIAFYASSAQLNRQKIRMQAQQELRTELEFWMAITHVQLPREEVRQLSSRRREVVLNENSNNPIIAEVWREPFLEVMEEENRAKLDHFQIIVTIQYIEPPLLFSGRNGEIYNTYSLIGYWVPSLDN